MENLTRFRQDEALRVIQWTVDCSDEWGDILDLHEEGTTPERMRSALNAIRRYEFYFLLPLVLDRGNMDVYTDMALKRLQVEGLIRTANRQPLDSICADLIQAMEAAVSAYKPPAASRNSPTWKS